MTDKELRQMKRAELIEMLYYMRTQIDELQAENHQLKNRLDALVGEAVQKKKSSEDGEQIAHESQETNFQ